MTHHHENREYEWLENLIQRGENSELEAICELTQIYRGEKIDCPHLKDRSAAMTWCRRAAKFGHLDSQILLALMIVEGVRDEIWQNQDVFEALHWCSIAQKSPHYNHKLGRILHIESDLYNLGQSNIKSNGLSILEILANSGNISSQLALADFLSGGNARESGIYTRDDYVEHDYQLALKWYECVASRGGKSGGRALRGLARMYYLGFGVEKDEKRALTYLIEAGTYLPSQHEHCCRPCNICGIEIEGQEVCTIIKKEFRHKKVLLFIQVKNEVIVDKRIVCSLCADISEKLGWTVLDRGWSSPTQRLDTPWIILSAAHSGDIRLYRTNEPETERPAYEQIFTSICWVVRSRAI